MTFLAHRFRQALVHWVLRNPTDAPDAQLSMMFYDDVRPTARLLDLAARSIEHARHEDLSDIDARMPHEPRWPNLWPGEHYRLLAGMVATLRPSVVVEIGTYQGLGALALAKRLPPGGKVFTFDVVPYDRVPEHCFRPSDFEGAGGSITQIIADLVSRDAQERHRALIESAELIFVDAAKDGRMEKEFLDYFERLRFRTPPIVVFDDIRVWNMLGIWHRVRRPKLDLTSFGHHTGTGLIDWSDPATNGVSRPA
jgi:predicted O-methyltransferase YrrM